MFDSENIWCWKDPIFKAQLQRLMSDVTQLKLKWEETSGTDWISENTVFIKGKYEASHASKQAKVQCSLRKHAYSNILKILPPKMKIFR